MNQYLIPRYTPYFDLSDYFDAYAISGSRLANTSCPCYLFFAEDDMIIPSEDIALLADNPNLHIVRAQYGGHCGFWLIGVLIVGLIQQVLPLLESQ